MSIGEHLVLSHGEELSGGSMRQSSLSDAFEAVLGAVFIDGGFEAAHQVILSCFREDFGELTEIPNLANPKGELQELLQTKSSEPPRYELFSASGPDHDRNFECAVFHQGVELGRGIGKSKKAAESHAALVALEQLEERSFRKHFTSAPSCRPPSRTFVAYLSITRITPSQGDNPI